MRFRMTTGLGPENGIAAPEFRFRAGGAAALLLLAALSVAAEPAPPELPEDLGPAVIDVSGYPPEHQETYRTVFLPVYGFLRGGAARALNGPLLELDPQGEAVLRREQPELFARPGLVAVEAGAWRREVMRVKNRPPCCGACPILSMADAKRLWSFLVYDSVRRKTGANAAAWAAHRRALVERFEKTVKGPSGAGRH
jgi:hypothetical protein